MDKKIYICTGTCRAEISKDQYDNGLVKCGTKTCDRFGQSFEEKIKCEICGKIFNPSKNHSH